MRKFSVVLLSGIIAVLLLACNTVSEKEHPSKGADILTEEIAVEKDVCTEHDFGEASLIHPAVCQFCKKEEGHPLFVYCVTWEDVVNSLYLEDYKYVLSVSANGNGSGYILKLTFDDSSSFTEEESLKEFMAATIVSLTELSGFVRGNYLGKVIDTPSYFRGDIAVTITIPGGTIIATLINGNMFGFYTVLVKDNGSQNVDLLENIYNESFVKIGVSIG